MDPELAMEAQRTELDGVCVCAKNSVLQFQICPQAGSQSNIADLGRHKQVRLEPNVRGGICVQTGAYAAASLGPEKLFSAMPPLEALKILMALKTSRRMSKTGRASRTAPFLAGKKGSSVEVPSEDPMKAKGNVARLGRSMYGTQDASDLKKTDPTAPLESHGYAASRSDPAVLFGDKVDTRLLVRVGRLCATWRCLQELLKTKYTAKLVAQIGDGEREQEAVILSPVVRCVPRGCRRLKVMALEESWS